MPSMAEYKDLWEGVEKCYAQQRLAHAYLIAGPPRGAAGLFAEAMIQLVLGTDESAQRRLAAKSHPDVMWVEPESKSRMILVDKMRALKVRLGQTAMEGGWKVGVVSFADRLNDQASNAFLKTLEEPSGQTLLLLLTDEPHQLLPTIRSRCQLIHLNTGKDPLKPEWQAILVALLREQHLRDIMHTLVFSDNVRGLLDVIKKSFSDQEEDPEEVPVADEGASNKQVEARVQSRLLEVRQQVLIEIMHWYRDLLVLKHGLDVEYLHYADEHDALSRQAAEASVPSILRRLEAVEELHTRLQRNIPPANALDAAALSAFVRR